ncbi:hypothetical protein IVA98_32970 [Bradyrhizobium sp. 160]|uniref:hypothetical protein n=1 Tax=unclassified Bradyrhizobium TaxID=2631580 RepID=UPI001FF83773|nr:MULTISPECIES: hypothetical protein [unclassified Bradyrhizobium]MCK1542214.1 hypothetical protein [Bradyrhizobium sp. 179]MCK1627842.1 hypothetical protein [Bradyrhizobium sp. 160]
MVAAVATAFGYGAAYFYFTGRISTLEERLKLAQESKGTYQVRIAEVTRDNPYRIGPTDDLVQVNLSEEVSPVILLPSGFLKGKTVSIKDKKGDSDKRAVIIKAEGGSIDGSPDWRIESSFASVSFVWDGNNWSAY